jgi:nucleotide-binding universal stress UspA family protein
VAKAKVMVALRDAGSVESLVGLACQLSHGMDAELTALHVVEVPLATPLEASNDVLDHPGKEIVARARQVAEGYSKQLTTRLLRARDIGETVVGEAKERDVDLLIMGYHRKRGQLAEILLGSTAQYVVHHAPCRIIVEILPPPHR